VQRPDRQAIVGSDQGSRPIVQMEQPAVTNNIISDFLDKLE